jgi:hypothetical protein
MIDLSRFREIVVGDSEFVPRPGEKPDPVAVCAKELRSGRLITMFRDEMRESPPYPIDDEVLFVAFAAAAELETHLALGWRLPKHVLDLRVEHINCTNKTEKRRDDKPKKKQPRSLLEILRSYGIPDGDAQVKAETVERIKKGWPFTAEERDRILRYCLSDAVALESLLRELVPQIDNLDRALRRGEYVALTAQVADNGIPFDPWAMSWLNRPDIRHQLRLRLVSSEDLTHGLYEGTTLKQNRLREFVVRHGLPWPKTPKSGRLRTADAVFEEIAETHPEFAGLAEIKKTLSMLHEFELASGSDGRCRTAIWAFSTITSRMAPDGAAYPFTTAAWTRNLITPKAGTVLIYLDFASMEFGVAAGLSRCAAMIDAYLSGDPYSGLGARAGLHRISRNQLKPVIISLQYGSGVPLIMGRLGVQRRKATRLHDLHHREFAGYWAWSDRKLARAFADGALIARDGWRCQVTSRTSEFTARNWFIQANAAAIFRHAGLMARRLGLKICAVVHDALLIEAPAGREAESLAKATACLERASCMFLHGLSLRGDAKVIRQSERFSEERGAKVWGYVEKTLREMDDVRSIRRA